MKQCSEGGRCATISPMRWPFSKRKESENRALTIREALASSRPDLEVSLWLQRSITGASASAPDEEEVAYLADKFLREVNSGGFMGFFSWEFEAVKPTVEALGTIGVPEVANTLQEAMDLASKGAWFGSESEFAQAGDALLEDEERAQEMEQLDQSAIAASGLIEGATHKYIRGHLEAFGSLDQS